MLKIYLDTSVLLPLVIQNHEIHDRCNEIFTNGLDEGMVITSVTHAYAEMYRNLTCGKTSFEVLPVIAQDVIINKLSPLMTVIELSANDYHAAIARCVELNLTSSIIYDALHVQAALKAEADILYTNNLRDFNRLVTEEDDIVIKGIR